MAIGSSRAIEAPTQNETDHPSQLLGSSSIKPARRKSALKRLLMIGCLGISTVGMTGCTLSSGACRGLTECECIDDFMIGYRNRAMAEKAWHCRKHQFCDTRFASEYKDGFIQGYMEVASGGTGCTPAIAPSTYWGWKYQTPGGHAAVNAWFQGFPQGVRAAEEDGVGNWQGIQMNYLRRPAPVPPPIAPLIVPSDDEADVDNPFYSDEEEETTPEAEPAMGEDDGFRDPDTDAFDIDPDGAESIELPATPEPDDSVFDDLFPPVAVETASSDSTAPQAVVAEGSVSDQSDDDGLSFTFE